MSTLWSFILVINVFRGAWLTCHPWLGWEGSSEHTNFLMFHYSRSVQDFINSTHAPVSLRWYWFQYCSACTVIFLKFYIYIIYMYIYLKSVKECMFWVVVKECWPFAVFYVRWSLKTGNFVCDTDLRIKIPCSEIHFLEERYSYLKLCLCLCEEIWYDVITNMKARS